MYRLLLRLVARHLLAGQAALLLCAMVWPTAVVLVITPWGLEAVEADHRMGQAVPLGQHKMTQEVGAVDGAGLPALLSLRFRQVVEVYLRPQAALIAAGVEAQGRPWVLLADLEFALAGGLFQAKVVAMPAC